MKIKRGLLGRKETYSHDSFAVDKKLGHEALKELLMRSALPGVALIGVGAAFDFIAGTKKQAPEWMQKAGLEWLFRFVQEPRRLWRRYLWNNPSYLLLLGLQVLKSKLKRS